MKLRIYKDAQHCWRWSLMDKANGKILADCGQGYSRKKDMMASLEKVTNGALLQMIRNDLAALLITIDRIQDGNPL